MFLERYEKVIVIVTAFFFIVAAVYLHSFLNKCTACRKLNVKEAHRQMCPSGHVYYNCQPTEVSDHAMCYIPSMCRPQILTGKG